MAVICWNCCGKEAMLYSNSGNLECQNFIRTKTPIIQYLSTGASTRKLIHRSNDLSPIQRRL